MMFLRSGNSNKITCTKGFSIVEVLVYLAIFMVVSTTSVTFLLSLNKFIDQYRIETMLYRSSTSVMEQILLTIRQADSVDLSNTVLDTPAAGQLTLVNKDNTTEIKLSGGALNLTINGVEYGDLTGDPVMVDGFTIYDYPVTAGEMVRVKLELTATLNATTQKSITLYGGAVVRGAI